MEVRTECREVLAVDRGWMRDRNCDRVSRCPRADTHIAKNPSGSSRPTRTSLNIFLTKALLSSAPAAAEGGIFKWKVTKNYRYKMLQSCCGLLTSRSTQFKLRYLKHTAIHVPHLPSALVTKQLILSYTSHVSVFCNLQSWRFVMGSYHQ